MYRQPPKRQQVIRRIVIYSAMSAVILALVTALIFVMLGYQFNQNDGKIEQGGLVQFDSKPNGANVNIDGANLGSQTASKATLTAGQHYIKLQRNGYKSWQKAVTVVPGAVLWLNYARLIPNDLKQTNVAQFSTVSSTASSPDDKWMAIKEDPASATIRLADLSQDMPKVTSLELPQTSYTHSATGKPHAFTLEKWDPDSRYILVRHVYDNTKIEWLVVDSQNVEQTKNVTKLLSIDVSKILFSESNSSLLYVQIGTDIRKVDLGAATLSRPLVTNVADFSLYESTIVYTTLINAETKARTVGYYEDGAEKPETIRSYQDDGRAPLRISIGKYFSDTYVAIAYSEELIILKGKLPVTGASIPALKTVATLPLPGGAQYLSIKTNGRFIIAQNVATYKVYDVELQKNTTTTLKGTMEVTKEIQWLDKYMLWSDRDNMVRFYEFDGANQHDIMPVVSGFTASLSPNSKYLYGINKDAAGLFHLQRVQLLL